MWVRPLVPWLAVAALVATRPAGAGADPKPPLDAAHAERLARLALACVHREYPNKIAHSLIGDDDVKPPRELTPAFYGCYDWHSSVHGHWQLARLARLFPDAAFAGDARAALAESLTPAAIAAEVRYLEGRGRVSFERPYGLAWLLQLGTEMREWPDPEAQAWSRALAPLEAVAAARLKEWLPKLAYPIRVGEHSQTAFAFGLALDWARGSGDTELAALLESRSRTYYEKDRDCPLAYEPSGEDFLSPCLAEADLLRRILAPPAFAQWLTRFLPRLPVNAAATWLRPGLVTDRADPKLAHIDGLNLSRAWMLEGITEGLPPSDRRAAALRAAARAHRDAGLVGVTGEHYEGGHWLGTFAVYLLTRRGHWNPPMPLIEPGKKAPAFALKDQSGKTHRLSEYVGRPVILYFYPKDGTPGCTPEACAFQAGLPSFKTRKAAVLGVGFPLLADPEHEAADNYGVWQKKSQYGDLLGD